MGTDCEGKKQMMQFLLADILKCHVAPLGILVEWLDTHISDSLGINL